jgi:SAM-dependent methyltransferase
MAVTTTKTKTVEEVNEEFFGEFFNDNMVDYLSKSAGSRWFKDLLLMILWEIKPKDVKSVADVGCGIGHKTSTLKKYFKDADVSGFDFAKPAIETAKKAYGKPQGIYFSAEDITKTNYKKKYDLISAFDVLEHVDDWQGLIKDLIKVNNRYMLFSFPTGRMRPYEVNIGHYRNFKRNEVENFMEKQGYKTIKTFYAGFPFFSPITRDMTQLFFKNYSETPNAKMSVASKQIHNVWYILFRYFSRQQKGDVFIGLFEKDNTKIKKRSK